MSSWKLYPLQIFKQKMKNSACQLQACYDMSVFQNSYKVILSIKVWQPSQNRRALALLTLGILLREHRADHHGWKWILWLVFRGFRGRNCPGQDTRGYYHVLVAESMAAHGKMFWFHISFPGRQENEIPPSVFSSPLAASVLHSPPHPSPTCPCSELYPWLKTN